MLFGNVVFLGDVFRQVEELGCLFGDDELPFAVADGGVYTMLPEEGCAGECFTLDRKSVV